MKTAFTAKATAAVLSSTIALTSISAAPANAITDEEALLLFFGIAAIAALSNSATPAPAPAPVTYSTGPILLKQTYTANFDNGAIGGPGADIWFQAATPVKRFLKPRNGAKMAVGNRSNRGFAGCSVASYSAQRVNINQLPVGSYVCMKTNVGRISQFRVNAVYGGAVKKMKLRYTTWQ